MKNTLLFLLSFLFSISFSYGQSILNPSNHNANLDLLKSGAHTMSWFMVQDSTEMKIGNVKTEINKEEKKTYIITTVDMNQSPSTWVDSTVVTTLDFKPIYHSSYNMQRDMVLKFGNKITGYYFDKQSNTKSKISEETNKPFFDSNFYPQLIRLLPLKEGYTNTISIFDYNPKSKTGVITATIKNTAETTIYSNGELKEVWKIETTDDISNNTAISTYYIDKSTRQLLKQEIDFGGRKMIMRLIK